MRAFVFAAREIRGQIRTDARIVIPWEALWSSSSDLLFVLALVQGIVDHRVHITHRIESSALSTPHAGGVAAGVTLAALTAIAGSGSLGLFHFPAFASTGIVTTLGTGCLIATLTVVPAVSSSFAPRPFSGAGTRPA